MYYKLIMDMDYFESTERFIFFFKTKEEAELKRDELDEKCEFYHCFSISEVSFEEMKQEISVNEFEKLFDIKVLEPSENGLIFMLPAVDSSVEE